MTSFDYLSHLTPPEETVRVVISRHWNNPEIKVTVNRQQIELTAHIGEFVDALMSELGNPVLILTRKQLRRKMAQAANRVIEKMKEASTSVM